MKLIESKLYIQTEVGTNANKWWRVELYDNDDVVTRWARVGYDEQSKTFSGKGRAFMESKIQEKLRGKIKNGQRLAYTEAKTIQDNTVKVNPVNSGDLHSIAKTQLLKLSNPTLENLVKRLVNANIHKITANTNISYNSTTGLFSTPLGIVTPDGLLEARDLLAKIAPLVRAQRYDTQLSKLVSLYLRLIPQNVGMKLKVEALLPDDLSLQKQNDLIDSLEASYQTLRTAPTSLDRTADKVETVFQVDLNMLEDSRERRRIEEKYRTTRKDQHVCAHLKVKEIYSIEIKATKQSFDQYGHKVGEIKELWHGSSVANVLSILKSGLQIHPPSTAKIAGDAYGQGLYFASASTKSLNYAYGYWSGTRNKECFMFLADVALGKYYVPSGGYGRVSYPKVGYDSTWAQGGRSGVINDEFIIYKANQHNLKYLVEFA